MLAGVPKAFGRAFGNVILLLVTQDDDLVTRGTIFLTCERMLFFFFLMQKALRNIMSCPLCEPTKHTFD